MWSLLLPIIAVLFGIVIVVIVRQRQMAKLVERGREAQAQVVSCRVFNSNGPRTLRIRYQFRDQHGQEHHNTVTQTAADSDELKPGDPFPIVYLPDRPRISASKALIEQIKLAMKARQ
ncbi:DUF3592 domain-containing protein [Permianibacter aggregans]|uniref:Uncharacterized protein DUF3592 n=1 Tax=Permianibacter aggregans TaxID=1510150 RepID=A0A4R6UYS6_9GAMM|nr:DUF3592 domain-containing protein [Permianibacter aggregans]QGX41457.1 DUF3592 domain-containing protein [Permianibacter aggregans]TDQ51249.1 uncharacterized protein DUF3592 [Permianibacter aggregans]